MQTIYTLVGEYGTELTSTSYPDLTFYLASRLVDVSDPMQVADCRAALQRAEDDLLMAADDLWYRDWFNDAYEMSEYNIYEVQWPVDYRAGQIDLQRELDKQQA